MPELAHKKLAHWKKGSISDFCDENLRMRRKIRRNIPIILVEKNWTWTECTIFHLTESLLPFFSHKKSVDWKLFHKCCLFSSDWIGLDRTTKTIQLLLPKSINYAVLFVVDPTLTIRICFAYVGINWTHCLHMAILFKLYCYGTVFRIRFFEQKRWKKPFQNPQFFSQRKSQTHKMWWIFYSIYEICSIFMWIFPRNSKK